MIVREDVEAVQPTIKTRKPSTRRSSRRASDSFQYTANDMHHSVWSALFYLVRLVFFVQEDVHGFFCTHCVDTFNLLAAFTNDDVQVLTESQMLRIEAAFRLVHSEIDHLFLPFVKTPTYWDKAGRYLDIQFLVDFVKSYQHRTFETPMNRQQSKEMREHFRHFLNLFDEDRRLTM